MEANIDAYLSMFTTVGFPAAISLILLKYVLHTIGEKVEKLESAINSLIQLINSLDRNENSREKRNKEQQL